MRTEDGRWRETEDGLILNQRKNKIHIFLNGMDTLILDRYNSSSIRFLKSYNTLCVQRKHFPTFVKV